METATATKLTEPRGTLPHEKPTKGVRCEVEVDCMVQGQQFGAYLMPLGKSRFEILERDVPALQAMVEPDMALFAQAKKTHDMAREKFIAESVGNATGQEGAMRRERAASEYIGSPQAVFRSLTGGTRDLQPLRSVEVIAKGLPSATDTDRVESEGALAKALGLELAKAFGRK